MTNTPEPEEDTGRDIAVGTLAYDIRIERVGVVMEECGTRYALRPPHGGREWEAPADEVRPATVAERIRSELAERNANSRKGNGRL
ncbi:hypothetical protein GCM10010387_04360 [Streptomyces inusitatus]|uniref:Uncharacterized protein n=1 Tax=Streptomyces inusitatus TaxID=68221 RepID=A0A918UJN5_9ACTN|nr:hypothetical protein [Streptomyces inusitatus]GGZ15197.1 hypothetical protein GCM10010387_04360 [Streptomyces inusitatus]